MEYVPGFHYRGRDEYLLWFVLVDNDVPEGEASHATHLFSPSKKEIEKILVKYDLPVAYVTDLIEGKDESVNGWVIDLKTFRRHLRDEEYIL